MPEQDPHAALHEQAAGEHEDHEPALAEGAAGDDLEQKLNALDQRLTGRINALRKDTDTYKKTVSESVIKIQQGITELKTATENNAASIEAQNGAIETAGKKADAAKKSADDAATVAARVETALGVLAAEYRTHTHDVTISLNGETDPPRPPQPPGSRS